MAGTLCSNIDQCLTFRASVHDDLPVLEALYRDAFPDEELIPLVRKLPQAGALVSAFVGIACDELIAHVAFTECRVNGCDCRIALLSPLAVSPGQQRKGVGRRLVNYGIQQLDGTDLARVVVLGDPAYYERLGFRKETEVEPPYELPAEWDGAWQSIIRRDEINCTGKLDVPKLWHDPRLWSA